MAKYDVTFSCGHEETVELFGKETEREKKIKWYEKFGLCSECRKAEQERKEEDIEKTYSLPKLTGSDKQISWARSIRANAVRKVAELVKERIAESPADEKTFQGMLDEWISCARKETKASWWIARRNEYIISMDSAKYPKT
jgi:hypothetical protein